MSYKFLDFDLHPLRYQLRRGTTDLDVPRRIFDLILLLIRHRDRPVSKEEILSSVWHGRTVTDASLTHAVADARSLLGDSPESQSVIKTVPRRGYWWVAETREVADREAGVALPGIYPFVGHGSELMALSRSLDGALGGKGSLVLLIGEAGIGKTRLLGELCREARQRQFKVFRAYCMEDEGAPPGWPWIQVLRSSISELDTVASSARVLHAIEQLGSVLPEARFSTKPNAKIAHPQAFDRFSLFEHLWVVLSAIARSSPTLVAIDDLHRADDLSLSALRFIVRQAADARLLIACAARDASPRKTSLGVADLARQPRSITVPVGGLTRADISAFLESTNFGSLEGLGDELFERSGGNPFFVIQLVGALHDLKEQEQSSAIRDVSRLPNTIREAILQQISGLSPRVHEVLHVAASIGRTFAPRLVAEVLDTQIEEVVAALEAGEKASLIEDDPLLPGNQRFRHVLVRDVLYRELSRTIRAGFHRQIARSLKAKVDAEPAAAVAHHLRSAYPLAEIVDVAQATLVAARNAAARSSFADAEEQCRSTLNLLGLALSPEYRCALLLAMASAQLQAGRRRDGRLSLRSAASLARTAGLNEQLADAALSIAPGFFSIETGMVDAELIETLEEALKAVPETDSLVRVRLLGNLCAALYWSPYQSRNAELVEQAERMASRLGSREANAHALASRYVALWSPSNLEERATNLRNLMEVAELSGEIDLRLMARVFRLATFLETADLGRFTVELDSFEELVSISNHPHAQWYVPMYRAMLAITRGEFSTAERLIGEFVSRGTRFEDTNVAQTFLLQSAELAWQRGKANEILASVEENVFRNPVLREWQCALAFLFACAGRVAESSALSREVVVDWERNRQWRMNATIGFAAIAEAAWLLDDAELAASLEGIFPGWKERIVIGGYGVLCWGSLSRSLGHIASAQGRWDEAEACYLKALASEEAIGAVAWVPRTRAALARAMFRRGKPTDGVRSREIVDRAEREARKANLGPLIGEAAKTI